MIITRTPFRISFFGGGTDFPDYYLTHGGSVLSSTINKYCYITTRYLPPFFDYKYRIRYSIREETSTIEQINHPVVREVLRKLRFQEGLEVIHTSDIPAMSGIGSSSAFTVGFLHAMHALTGRIVTKRMLATEAIEVEQQILKENVGSQDQVATAFGGMNRIDFSAKGYYVTPITISAAKRAALESRLMLFFTGFTRFSSEIAKEQVANIPKTIQSLDAMKPLVDQAIGVLNGEGELDDFGRLLDEGWNLKKSLSGSISNGQIDEAYAAAKRAGAKGGKILGAGGGFLLLFAPPEAQGNIRAALSNLLLVPFCFEDLGTQIIMYSTIKG
jgi:D-glycero-alpha-D-manno-heptose-7-phosphate kinase